MRSEEALASWNSTMLAVNPWTKLRAPTGPNSPAQSIPATAPERTASATARASWSGSPKKRLHLEERFVDQEDVDEVLADDEGDERERQAHRYEQDRWMSARRRRGS